MSKAVKAALSAVLCVVAVLSLFAFKNGGIINPSVERYALSTEEFSSRLSDIYSRYDVDYNTVDDSNQFALKRLVVTGFKGKTYSASECIYDRENDLAVLQYDSEEKAQSAMLKFQADGVVAEPDGLAYLDGDIKGSFCPEGSEKVGTTQYINSYAMPSDEVIVAVIDTGVMYDHTAIADRFYSTGYDLTGDGYDNAYYDTERAGAFYHSTMVCGIIADNTPDNVRILPYKVVENGASAASASAVINAINRAVNAGATVINASLHTSYSETAFRNAVANAASKGVCVCASAGNDSSEITGIYPACCNETITVSALNGDEFRSTSNYGDVIDFAAPGTKIRSPYPGENGASVFARANGTSFASPYLAAICADIKSINNKMAFDDVYNTICDFAVDYGDEGFDKYFGNGVPSIANIVYTDGESYEYKIPQGTLSIYKSEDYTAETQPWRIFADKLVSVSVDSSVERIGDYCFYNMQNADFDIADTYNDVGKYAFYGCSKLGSFTFGADVERVDTGAFGGINGFVINGYRNTPAESYALGEGVNFNILGCKHNYIIEVFEATSTHEAYTLYTCTVCGDTYTGDYVTPVLLDSGQCGENLTYRFDSTGMLKIEGYGDMYDYMNTAAPWYSYAEDITILRINEDVESISPFAFYGCQIGKIRCSEDNENMYSDGFNLVSASDGELLLNCTYGEYTVPDYVTSISAPAFIMSGAVVKGDERFKTENGIVYDSEGYIVMAQRSFKADSITLEKNTGIRQYAFILCEYPAKAVCYSLSNDVEDYSLGFTFDGSLRKTDMTVTACEESTLGDYAIRFGFALSSENLGVCGDDIVYKYDSETQTLTLYGSGDMYTYSSLSQIPWKNYLSTLKTVVIGENITSLSPYSFYGASSLSSLTLPLSLSAPADSTVWNNCINLASVDFTLGTGVMDDYILDDGTELFAYTPWYLSRKTLSSVTIHPDVKYIGKQAFRYCFGITELTLNCCEEIGSRAFSACTKLNEVTINSKDTVIGDYALFSYSTGTKDKFYSGKTVIAYSDSNAKDYADANGIDFVSLGCGHSRSVELSSTVNTPVSKFYIYRCNDCGEEFTQSDTPDGEGYPVTFSVKSTNGAAIKNAQLLVNGQFCGVTDENGVLSLGKVLCGNYTLSVYINGTELVHGIIGVSAETQISVTARYADYVADGVINAKDYAYSVKQGFNDKELFDYGRVGANDNRVE